MALSPSTSSTRASMNVSGSSRARTLAELPARFRAAILSSSGSSFSSNSGTTESPRAAAAWMRIVTEVRFRR